MNSTLILSAGLFLSFAISSPSRVALAQLGPQKTSLLMSPCKAAQSVSNNMLGAIKPKALLSGKMDMGQSSSYPTCNPNFLISYRAFIPVDHVVTYFDGCTYPGTGEYVDYMYLGDGGPQYVGYRVNQSVNVTPETAAFSGPFSMAGTSEQFAYGSPAIPPDISVLDFDATLHDCYLLNDTGQASSISWTNSTTASAGYTVTLFHGESVIPLSHPIIEAGPIRWTITSSVNTANYYNPTSLVTYSHSCYPYHQLSVNGQLVLDDPPRFGNDFVSILACLELPVLDVTGTIGPVSVPML